MSKDLCIDFDQVVEQKDKALDYTVLHLQNNITSDDYLNGDFEDEND